MKIARRVLSLVLVCLLMATLVLSVAAANEDDSEKKRYNVVFVTDESGSMNWTDQNRLRYEAIRRFVALMAQNGNYLGNVTFDDEIMDSTAVKPVSGFPEKEAFIAHIEQYKPHSDTNIGLALMEAVKLLDEGKNPDNPSVIILLSDGNTDLKPEEAMEESLNMKAEAIEMARQAGYQIYTICLNTDGSANIDELKQIATATGGEFREVNNAEDLEEIQTMYYTMIFGAVDSAAEDILIDDKGYAEKEFEVPRIGVEEFNVMLEGSIDSYSLISPSGYEYTQAELKAMSMAGRDFVVVKVEEPEGGPWKVVVYGKPGAEIHFRLLYNSDFYITGSVSPTSDYKLDQTVRFSVVINDRHGAIMDAAKYEGFGAQLHLTVNGVESVHDMNLGSEGFYYDVTLSEEGTYKAYMTASNGTVAEKTEKTFELNVNNSAPGYTGEELSAHAYVWPVIGGSAQVELSGAVVDPDGDEVTFSVDSSAFMPEDYTLDGTSLTVSNFSIRKGSFTIRATDPYGASCTFDVNMTSTNVGLVMAIAVVVIGLIVLLVIAFILWRLAGIPFMGSITVERFDIDDAAYHMPATLNPGRGRQSLESFGLTLCGLPAGSYFQAGGKKKCIYFCSKKPVYSTMTSGATKKVTIDGNGLEVMIYADANMEKGIRVTFSSVLYNNF